MSAGTKKSRKGGSEPGTSKRSEEQEKELEKLLNSTDPHVIEKSKQVGNVFSLFDQGNQRLIDVREVGTVLRALGLYPCESEVQEIIQNVEEAESHGFVKYDRFVPFVTKILLEGDRYKGPTGDDLRFAFSVLDIENVGKFELKRFRDLMTKDGEPFSPEEFEEMMKFGLNDDGKFHWRDYLTKTGVDNQVNREKRKDSEASVKPNKFF